MHRSLAPLALFLLAACGQADNDPGPGGVTVGEAKALDEAAEMIEGQKMPDDLARPPLQAVPAATPQPTPESSAKPTG